MEFQEQVFRVFPWNLTHVADEKGEGGGGEKRGGREKLLPKLKAEVYSKNDRQKYSNGQSRGYIPWTN